MEADHNEELKNQMMHEQEEAKLIENARKKIKKQDQDDSALDQINNRIKKSLMSILHVHKPNDEERHEAVKKAFTIQKMIDPCIMFSKGGED